MINNKLFAIWGTGNRSAFYTEMLKPQTPDCYIDNELKKAEQSFRGKKVLHPSKITNWKDYFIVIAIDKYDEVKKQLEDYGLQMNKDFVHYSEVIKSEKILQSLIDEMNTFLEYVKENAGSIKSKALIFGAMAGFDPNFVTNMNMLYEKYGECSFFLFSEAIKMKELSESGGVNFPYAILPKLFYQNYYIRKSGNGCIDLDIGIETYINEKEYLNNALLIMREKNLDIETNYDVIVIYYYDYFINYLLEMLSPQCVVMWNQFYPFHLILDNVCKERGIETVYVEHGALPGTYVIEKMGQMGEGIVARESDWFRELPVTREELTQAKDICSYLYESKLNRNVQPINNALDEVKEKIDNSRPIIFYAGQNDYESGFFPYGERAKKYHSPVFSSSYDALDYLAEIAEKKNWNLIYKPHPLCEKNMKEIPENVILVRSCDINELIDMSDVTITILSQVGYISTIRRKATVMLGFTQLKNKNCTYEAFEREQVEAIIERAIEYGFTEGQESCFIKHVAQLVKYYLYDNNGPQKKHFGQKLIDVGQRLSL